MLALMAMAAGPASAEERAVPRNLLKSGIELLALTAYVAHQSRSMPVNVAIDGQNRRNFNTGAICITGARGR